MNTIQKRLERIEEKLGQGHAKTTIVAILPDNTEKVISSHRDDFSRTIRIIASNQYMEYLKNTKGIEEIYG